MVVSLQARQMARKMISERGKLLLGASLIQVVVALLLALVIMPFQGAPEEIGVGSMLTTLLMTFITVPIVLGLLHINNMVYYKRGCSMGNLFDFFRSYHVSLKVIGVSLVLSVFLFVTMIPIVMVMTLVLLGVTIASEMAFATLFVLLIVLVVIVLSIVISSIQMASYFIALRNRSISFGKLFSGSFKVGGRYMWRYFCLSFSFVGWWLLGSLLLIIPSAIAVPAIQSAITTGMGLGGSLSILIIGFALFFVYVIFLDVYINAATTVFFNCAIDEYEQKNPEYIGFVPPYVPEMREGSAFEQQPPTIPPQYAMPPSGPERPGAPEPAYSQPQGGELCEVVLTGTGVSGAAVAETLHQLSGLSLTEAASMVESAPAVLRRGISREEAEKTAEALRAAGAEITVNRQWFSEK